jgi:hypothetical protein
MPSQFQLRDLVNHAIIGATILLLLLLFLFLLYPHGWAVAVIKWQSIKSQVGDVVLLPALLVIVYVVGAVMPSTRSLQLFGEPRHLMHRVLRAFLVAPRMSQKSSQDPLIRQLFLKKAETQFQVHQGKSEEDWERTLFVLASASVLNESASLQQVDIERHFILMHFNSKLCMIFSLACVTTLVGFSWSFLSKIVTSMSWSGIGARYLALLALFFYVIARASGTKASQNHEHWRNLIVRSFVVSPRAQEDVHKSAKA